MAFQTQSRMPAGTKLGLLCLVFLVAGTDAWGRTRSRRSELQLSGEQADISRSDAGKGGPPEAKGNGPEAPGLSYKEMNTEDKDFDKDVLEYKDKTKKTNEKAKEAEQQGHKYLKELRQMNGGHSKIEAGIKHLKEVVEETNEKSLKIAAEAVKKAGEKGAAHPKGGGGAKGEAHGAQEHKP